MASRKNSLVGTRVAERLLCTVVIGVLVVVTVITEFTSPPWVVGVGVAATVTGPVKLQ